MKRMNRKTRQDRRRVVALALREKALDRLGEEMSAVKSEKLLLKTEKKKLLKSLMNKRTDISLQINV